MGFVFSKQMEKTLDEQKEFVLRNDRLQMERQLEMQNQMRERRMAMQIARSREFIKYFGVFTALATVGLTSGAIKQRRPGLLAPVLPLGFVLAYNLDTAYGTMAFRVREEAESIMASEQDRLQLPHGCPTFEGVEKSRRAKCNLASFLEK